MTHRAPGQKNIKARTDPIVEATKTQPGVITVVYVLKYTVFLLPDLKN